MRKIRFKADFYEAGALRYKSGEPLDPTPELEAQVARGNAEEVEVAGKPPAPARKPAPATEGRPEVA